MLCVPGSTLPGLSEIVQLPFVHLPPAVMHWMHAALSEPPVPELEDEIVKLIIPPVAVPVVAPP
jgi:hypothetical protein